MAEEKKPTGIKYQDKDLYFGRLMYLVNDDNQDTFELVGIILEPGCVKYKLTSWGSIEAFEVYDFQTSLEPDQMKLLKKKEQEED